MLPVLRDVLAPGTWKINICFQDARGEHQGALLIGNKGSWEHAGTSLGGDAKSPPQWSGVHHPTMDFGWYGDWRKPLSRPPITAKLCI